MVGSKCTRSKTTAMTQSATDPILHDTAASWQLPLSTAKATTLYPSGSIARPHGYERHTSALIHCLPHAPPSRFRSRKRYSSPWPYGRHGFGPWNRAISLSCDPSHRSAARHRGRISCPVSRHIAEQTCSRPSGRTQPPSIWPPEVHHFDVAADTSYDPILEQLHPFPPWNNFKSWKLSWCSLDLV
ncbi:hypothetical protein L3X38_016844 [Prunus dulcis]|uniref:Uncharacterized protein n=1 Tax=Prunus dulcis TaxID=3755 RepID=A0AAD4W6Z9_PRUDU|nr:hypothetical protein L3X38_016844 [Prunus dulcis]